MLEAITYQGMLRDIASRQVKEDTIGILITRPELATGKDIVSSLNYYHHMSGKNVDFYLPGYGAYWYGTYPDGREVTKIDGAPWSFSDQMFIRFIEGIESDSAWKYSGESELLLLEYCDGRLLYDGIMQIHLDQMLRDKVFPSTAAFFQQLFRVCREYGTLSDISNRFGLEKTVQVTREALLNTLPSSLKNFYTKEKYFCIKDCRKKTKSLTDKWANIREESER